MSDSQPLEIHINSTELAHFCQQLVTRSRDPAKTLDALITLEAFISHFGRSAQGSPHYSNIESILKQYSEKLRQQLLQQKTEVLTRALLEQNVAAITAIHTPLSRNGFYLILQTACAQFESNDMKQLQQWAADWTHTAKQTADACSAYPDAPDFKAAGIALEMYLAMEDIRRYITTI